MGYVDQFGVPVSAADGSAVRLFDAALSRTLTFHSDALADIDRAIAADGSLLMAHLLKALIYGLSTEKSLLAEAQSGLAVAKRLAPGGHPRESLHVRALEAWLRGQFSDACSLWDDILVECPQDALAMFAAHQGDFFLGQSQELRDRVARRLPDIERGSALEGYYLGMYAFGLEEMGDYEKALRVGRQAIDRDAHDRWAIHAVAHVFEMLNLVDEGERWLTARAGDWSADSVLAVHTWWHLALYYCDQQRWDRVLDVYDAGVARAAAAGVMELVDASALLWRLKLVDVDTGSRWQRLADAWEAHVDDAWYAFNDMHAMMAFAGAQRFDLARRLIGVLKVTAAMPTENGRVASSIGLPTAEALWAYAERRYSTAAALLRPLRAIAAHAGGSHAQRDVLALTLLSAAEKCGQRTFARALLNERLALRPASMLNRHWLQRVCAETPIR
jgi:tetratricopeptide (TPR) repeat protein